MPAEVIQTKLQLLQMQHLRQLKGWQTSFKPLVVGMKGFPDDVETKQGRPKVVVPGIASKPFIIVEGARMALIIIKPVTQLPIDNTKVVPWNYKRVIVTYRGKEVEE